MKDIRLDQIRLRLYGKGYPPTIDEAVYLFKKIDELHAAALRHSPLPAHEATRGSTH